MKKFKSVINKSVVAVLFASVALALPSCGKNERELPEYADDKTMTLGAWGGPPLTQEGYDVFADAGFNCVFLDWRQMSASVFKDVMGYAENAGVKVWVQTGSENYDKPDILQKVYDADLDQYPAFDGINFYDEPARNQLEGIGKLVPKFEANYPNGLFTINLFPSYANPSLLGAGGFSGYVNDFVDNILVSVVLGFAIRLRKKMTLQRGGNPYAYDRMRRFCTDYGGVEIRIRRFSGLRCVARGGADCIRDRFARSVNHRVSEA